MTTPTRRPWPDAGDPPADDREHDVELWDTDDPMPENVETNADHGVDDEVEP